jgi:hypothetical protein
MAAPKSLNPTGLELIACVGLGVLLGFSTASSHPGGGIAGLLGNMTGGFLVILLLLLLFKLVWRLGAYLINKMRSA